MKLTGTTFRGLITTVISITLATQYLNSKEQDETIISVIYYYVVETLFISDEEKRICD
ncbi:MAG: hypothetical protein ABJ048_01985 [Balneola sp.]